MARRKYGLSLSWKRATGVSALKGKVARATGIPTTRSGRQRKVGRLVTGGGCLLPLAGLLLLTLLPALVAAQIGAVVPGPPGSASPYEHFTVHGAPGSAIAGVEIRSTFPERHSLFAALRVILMDHRVLALDADGTLTEGQAAPDEVSTQLAAGENDQVQLIILPGRVTLECRIEWVGVQVSSRSDMGAAGVVGGLMWLAAKFVGEAAPQILQDDGTWLPLGAEASAAEAQQEDSTYQAAPQYQPPAAAVGQCPQGGNHVPGKVDRNGRLHCAKCGRFM